MRASSLFIPIGLSIEDIQAIVQASDGEYERIEEAYSIAKAQGNIKNLTAWMIAAMKSETPYSMPIKVAKSSNKDGFHNFEERTYDYDELEKKLRKN